MTPQAVLVLCLLAGVSAMGTTDPVREVTTTGYLFSYGVHDRKTGNNFAHKQSQDDGSTSGQYRVALPDGRTQVVTYTADENGYKAVVTYEGVATKHGDHATTSPPAAAATPTAALARRKTPQPPVHPTHPLVGTVHPAAGVRHPRPNPVHPQPTPIDPLTHEVLPHHPSSGRCRRRPADASAPRPAATRPRCAAADAGRAALQPGRAPLWPCAASRPDPSPATPCTSTSTTRLPSPGSSPPLTAADHRASTPSTAGTPTPSRASHSLGPRRGPPSR
ncbi:uncharacterized protein [Panulirus ornatus]|uniref:uncharacterized protein n=1 Tax=Panulirus ornatus TaxID=150431 RepID=UPI003A845212